jgi:hypothetical protein
MALFDGKRNKGFDDLMEQLIIVKEWEILKQLESSYKT